VSILSEPHFHNEDAARARLEAILCPVEPFAPAVGVWNALLPSRGRAYAGAYIVAARATVSLP
jgi:hypothetical protein